MQGGITREMVTRLMGADRRLGRLEAVEPGVIAYACVVEQQGSAKDGGTFTSGAWQDRTLNTILHDAPWLSLAANTITLTTGVYAIHASAPAFRVDQHITKLLRIAGGAGAADVLWGTAEYSGSPNPYAQTRSVIVGTITVGRAYGSEGYKVQHRCTRTMVTQGFGVSSAIATQNYTVVEIWKLA